MAHSMPVDEPHTQQVNQEDVNFLQFVDDNARDEFDKLGRLDAGSATSDSGSESDFEDLANCRLLESNIDASREEHELDRHEQEKHRQEEDDQEREHGDNYKVLPSFCVQAESPPQFNEESLKLQDVSRNVRAKYFIVNLENGTETRKIDQKVLATVSAVFKDAVSDCKPTSEDVAIDINIGTHFAWDIMQSWVEEKSEELKALNVLSDQDDIDSIFEDVSVSKYISALLGTFKPENDESHEVWITSNGLIQRPKSIHLELVTEVYLLADFLDIDPLMNATMDLIHDDLGYYSQRDGIPLYFLNTIWQKTNYDSSLRRIFLDALFAQVPIEILAEAVECGVLGGPVASHLLLVAYRR